MRSYNFLHLVFLVFFLLSLCGCNGNVHVTGKVAYPNGQPLTIGQVVFTDGFYLGKSDIDRKGEYSIHTLSRSDGIRKGTYRVYISGAARLEGGEMNFRGKESVLAPSPNDYKMADVVQLIDMQHTNPDATNWIFEVKKNSRIDLVVYPPGEVPESERTEAAKMMFDPEYRKRVKEQKAKEEGSRSDFITHVDISQTNIV